MILTIEAILEDTERNGAMRYHLIALSVALTVSCAALAQIAPAPAKEQEAIVRLIEKAAVRALTFDQGNVQSLTDARGDFTPEGWSAFIKNMKGWLDEKGAPAFSSSFVPSGNVIVIGWDNGVIHIKIPGTLTQTQNKSRTTYHHAEVDVRAGGEPVKIRQLEQIYAVH